MTDIMGVDSLLGVASAQSLALSFLITPAAAGEDVSEVGMDSCVPAPPPDASPSLWLPVACC